MPTASPDKLSYDPSAVKRREQERVAPANEIASELIQRRRKNRSIFQPGVGCGDWRLIGSVFEQLIARLARNYARSSTAGNRSGGGPLRGFAGVEISSIGLWISDIPIFVGDNGAWAALPSKPELDREGRRKTDINGRAIYTPVAEWRTRELSDTFSEAVVAAVHRAHPADLD